MDELKKQTTGGNKEILCSNCVNWEKRSKSAVEKAVEKMKGDLEKYKQNFVEEIRSICEDSREVE
jgi:hypothetical protein